MKFNYSIYHSGVWSNSHVQGLAQCSLISYKINNNLKNNFQVLSTSPLLYPTVLSVTRNECSGVYFFPLRNMRVLSDYYALWCGNLNRVVYLGWQNRKKHSCSKEILLYLWPNLPLLILVFPTILVNTDHESLKELRWNNVGKRTGNWVLRLGFSLWFSVSSWTFSSSKSISLYTFLKRGMLVSTSIDYWEDWMRLLLQRFSTVIGTLLTLSNISYY